MIGKDFPSLLASGFVADAAHEGTIYPSAGGSSANPRVQAVYWRCLTALFASARITNPAQRLALFCNVAPPVIDGIAISAVLERYRVEVHRVPLTTRLPAGRTATWGNVLYFFDVLNALKDEPDDLRFALVDSDVLVTAPLDPLWALLDQANFAGYVVDSAPDEPINGLTRRDLGKVAQALSGTAQAPLPHFGGELFAARLGSWNRRRDLFARILDQAMTGQGPAAGVLTEEHVFSIAFALLQEPVAHAGEVIRRIWTSPLHHTARDGDQALPLWHLPAEKRYGLADLYRTLAQRGFPTQMPDEEFRALAGRLCAVPRRGAAKLVRDGLRQVAAKVGLAR